MSQRWEADAKNAVPTVHRCHLSLSLEAIFPISFDNLLYNVFYNINMEIMFMTISKIFDQGI